MADDDDVQGLVEAPSKEELLKSLKAIDESSQKLQTEGKLMEALQAMEKSLILRGHVFGLKSEEVSLACKSVSEMCNYLAMTFLQTNDFETVNNLLRKAAVLTDKHTDVRAVTFNNFGCFYRKKGKLRTALAYVRKAIQLEASLEVCVRSADTHLNMCTILSELGKHQEALGHARTALKMLLMEMFGPEGYASATGDEGGSETPKLPADRVAVLVIAYHNLAVQLEHLKKYKKSLGSYEKAVKVCTTHLEESHPLVANITESYNAACQNLGALIAKQEQLAINKANKTAKRQGLRKSSTSKAGTLTSDQLNTIVLETEEEGIAEGAAE